MTVLKQFKDGTWQTVVVGAAATVTAGTTVTGAAGSTALVTNSGNSSDAVFNFTIPRGDTGATGPANTLAVGTVTTGPAGGSASASITGTAPNQTLNLTIPKGDAGDWASAQTINAQTGTSYTLQSSDVGKLVTFSSSGTAGVVTLTVNTGLGLTNGQRIDLAQLGTGQVQISGSATVNSSTTLKLRTRYSSATLIVIDSTTNTYLLVGDLASV